MDVRSRSSHARGEGGFTLIELIVVITIIGILAAVALPRLIPKAGQAKQAAARAQIEIFGAALDQFGLDTGNYPTTGEGLQGLVTSTGNDKWGGPYLKKALPTDPWGRPYKYQFPGIKGDYDIISYGRDGMSGGSGEDKDILSWE